MKQGDIVIYNNKECVINGILYMYDKEPQYTLRDLESGLMINGFVSMDEMEKVPKFAEGGYTIPYSYKPKYAEGKTKKDIENLGFNSFGEFDSDDIPASSMQIDANVSYDEARERVEEELKERFSGVLEVDDFWIGDSDVEDEKRVRVRTDIPSEEPELKEIERSGRWDDSYSRLCDELATYEKGGKVDIMLTDDDLGYYSILHKGEFIEKDFQSKKEAENWAKENNYTYAKGGEIKNHSEIVKLIESSDTYMTLYDVDAKNLIMYSTRENGNVGEELASDKDIDEAIRLKRIVESKFNNVVVEVEEVDEWVHLNIRPIQKATYRYKFHKHSTPSVRSSGFTETYDTMNEMIKKRGAFVGGVNWEKVKKELENIIEYPNNKFTGWYDSEPILISKPSDNENDWGYFFSVSKSENKNEYSKGGSTYAEGGEIKNGVYEYIELKGTRFEKNRGYTIRADKWNDLIEKGVLDSNDINLADDWRTAIKEENWGKYTRNMYSPKLDRLREQTENEFYNNKLYSKGGSTYAEGKEVYNAHILTNDNKLIHRRYPKKITHNEIYKEYKDKGVEIKDSQIHFAKPIDFYDTLREQTKKYVRENMNDDVDSENIFISSMQKGNEYIATEIKGDTISGKSFTITPKDLFEVGFKGNSYAEGGSIIGIQDAYELENQGNRYLESQGIDAKKFGVVHYDGFGKNSKLLKDVKGIDDEGNLNPLFMYERTPQTKSMTKGFQRWRFYYSEGGSINSFTAKGFDDEKFLYNLVEQKNSDDSGKNYVIRVESKDRQPSIMAQFSDKEKALEYLQTFKSRFPKEKIVYAEGGEIKIYIIVRGTKESEKYYYQKGSNEHNYKWLSSKKGATIFTDIKEAEKSADESDGDIVSLTTYAEGGNVAKVKTMVYSQSGEFNLEEYQDLSNEDMMGESLMGLEEVKAKVFAYNEEAYDYEDEINEIEDVDDLAEFLYDSGLAQRDNTYNQSWWGGVRLYAILNNDGDNFDLDYPTILFMSRHRGGDVRGNYEKYEAFDIEQYGYEQIPFMSATRLTYEVTDGNKKAVFETEDMEGYELYVVESDFVDFNEGDSTNMDEVGEKLGVELY